MNREYRIVGKELVLVALVIFLSLMLSGSLYKARVQKENAKILRNELTMLRSGVMLYYTLNKKFPDSLESLEKESYESPDGKKMVYLEKMPPQKKGEYIDPFGETYQYNSKTGWIESKAKGFHYW